MRIHVGYFIVKILGVFRQLRSYKAFVNAVLGYLGQQEVNRTV